MDFQDRLRLYDHNPQEIPFLARLQEYSFQPLRPRTYDEHWWDPVSSLMQSLHRVSMDALNNENREDESEIEVLDEASKITDNDLYRYKDEAEFYAEQHREALRQGNHHLSEFYRNQAIEAKTRYEEMLSVRKNADDIVRRDKLLFTLSGHNPITEAVLEIVDNTTTGLGIGSLAGGAVGSFGGPEGSAIGAIVGSTVGAVAGFLYGGYDYFLSDDGLYNIDRSAYTEPLSEDRNVNYANSIKTRLSYKDTRSKAFEAEQQDLLDWLRDYPISERYQMIEQSQEGNYLYYNLPGIVGSSFSDTKDLNQQMTSTIGINKLISKVGGKKTKLGLRALAFVEALRNGWQLSINENNAEVSEVSAKKSLDEIKKNKPLLDEMVETAKNAAMSRYGISRQEADETIDEDIAFTMYQGNVAGLDPKQLKNSYDYFKSARKLGDAGADQQFQRDMMATAGGDILEAALMVTPYGRLAEKSKLIGRAVVGAGIGAALGDYGMGAPGTVIGGAVGAVAAQNRFARKLWKGTMNRVQAIEDRVLPQLQKQVMFDKAVHAAYAFGTSSIAEAAEEGVQYINSKDAEKILSKADEEIGISRWTNLFTNDLKKRGQVWKAVLSQFGLAESPYQNDQEFWSNYKGGLFLGGIMTGATVAISEAHGAKKAWNMAKFVQNEIINAAVADRVSSQDAILKGATFAKNVTGNNTEAIIDILQRAKEKNKNRKNSPYSDADYDALIQQAMRMSTLTNSAIMKNRLKDLGYKPGSDEANMALSVYDYYLRLLGEIGTELLKDNVEIQKALNSEGVNTWLTQVAGPEILSSDGVEEGFKVKEMGPDGKVVEKTISERERLKRLQQVSARFIAVTQLLKDLNDVTKLKEFAKSQGLAFGSNQAERSITELKKLRDNLQTTVEAYSKARFDDRASYDQQIEYVKTLMGDYANSGSKLVDLYRNKALRDLNATIYKNILGDIGLGDDAYVANPDASKASHKMVDMFIANVKKNEQLQEIVDHTLKDSDYFYGNGAKESQPIELDNTEESTVDDLVNALGRENQNGKSAEDIKQYIQDQINDNIDKRDKATTKLFGRKKARRYGEQVDKWKAVYNKFFGEDEGFVTTEEENSEVESVVPKEGSGEKSLSSASEPPVAENFVPREDEAETTTTLDEEPGVVGEEMQSPEDRTEGDEVNPDEAPVEEVPIDEAPVAENELKSDEVLNDEENRTDIAVGDDGDPDLINTNHQKESVDKLHNPTPGNPRMLVPGWYITDSGEIIPSDRMFMANPVEVRRSAGQKLADKYREVAAAIRLLVFNIAKSRNTDEQKLNALRGFVSQQLRTTDVTIVDPIAKALFNGDKNAQKLVIMYANPRTWFSYQVNEYFRDSIKKILNGQVISRPEYIDPDAFRKFVHHVIQYRNIMQNRYGWQFVTDATPAITTVDGEQVIGEPDVIAVDRAGNMHIVNIHTMRVDDYVRWGKQPISMRNSNTIFSIKEERTAYADLQVKALETIPGVLISSCMLLPVIVNDYGKIYRLDLGEVIPVEPSEEAVSKYKNSEDQLDSLKQLLKVENEKALEWAKFLTDAIRQVKEGRRLHRTSGYRFKDTDTFEFLVEEEPSSIAEAYAQVNKADLFINRAKDFYHKHVEAELTQIQLKELETSTENRKQDVQKEIERINAMEDESKTTGVLVNLIGAEDIADNKDLLTNGKVKMSLATSTNGSQYLVCELEYKRKTYKIHLKRPKLYGGRLAAQLAPNYSKKLEAIAQLLAEHPEVVITLDLKRSYATYGEKPEGSKPTSLNDSDSILTQKDIDNLGVQQEDGKLVDIGFYDARTGVVLSGKRDSSPVLGRAPEGSWWQNQLFLVIRQRHSEDRSTERMVSIPVIKAKFNKSVSKFIAQCYKVIAETNSTVDSENQNRREAAIQMLHLFIGQRLMYDKNKEQLPNVVYTMPNGNVYLNGNVYNLQNNEDFTNFAKELGKCELMPKWEAFNSKFRDLASKSFSTLYDHFSKTDDDFVVSIDGVDSGLRITKAQYLNDTICQWYVRTNFLYSKAFVQKEAQFSIHNIQVGTKTTQQIKEDSNKPAEPVQKAKEEEIEELTEELLKEQGYTIIEDDDEDEDDDYDSPISTKAAIEYRQISELKNGNDAIKLISTQYKALSKILRAAAKKIGMPKITFVVHEEEGEWKEINGVKRLKKGRCTINTDGTIVIEFWQGNSNPIKTLAHEMVHAFTLGTIDKNTDFVRAAKIFFEVCKDTFTKEELSEYGFKNFKEFVAEFFTNPEMMNILKHRDPIDAKVMETIVKNANLKPKNAFQSVIAFISKAWQKYILRTRPSAYDQIYSIMRDLVEDSHQLYKYEQEEDRGAITILDIMKDVVGDIKAKVSSFKKKGYSYTNHVTKETVHLENCNSAAELRSAIDGIMTMWIKHEEEVNNISALGKNIDKLKFSTKDLEELIAEDKEFAEWWYNNLQNSDIPLVRELAEVVNPTKESLKSESNPKGYVTYEKEVKYTKRVNGKLVKVKKTETFYKVKLTKWDAVTPIIDQFMSDMRIETRKKVERRQEDQEMEDRENSTNVWGEQLTESMQISPLEKASREVKWLFSTVPAAKKNSLGMEVFMPFRDVFGKVLYYTARCRTTDEVLAEFANRAVTGPDKEMFAYLYNKLTAMRTNIWRSQEEAKKLKHKSKDTVNEKGLVFDADTESSLIKVMRTLRQQQNDFRWAYAENRVDQDGDVNKHIDIRTTLYQKGVIVTINSWRDQLATGQTGVLRYDANTLAFKYRRERDGLFKKIVNDLFLGKGSFLHAYDEARQQDGEDVTVKWEYLDNEEIPFSEITADDVKTYLHNALLELGIDVRQEVIDEWLSQIRKDNPTVETEMDALYALLSDQSSNYRPMNFFSRLAEEDSITQETIDLAFSSGFVKQLANLQNEYDLRTNKLMTVASHNNQYYIVSESNYVNDTAKILSSGDQNDSYIQMLQEDTFAKGSVVSKMLIDGLKLDIKVSTFVGMKTKNPGDAGRDYFEIGLDEDIISKFELLHEGYMISPTQSDKKTYHVLKGIPLVGMMIGGKTNTDCYTTDIKFNEVSIRDNELLDRFISYFRSERDAVEKAIIAYENEYYKYHPGEKIANYSDQNGMRFSSFNSLPLANGEDLYLNTVGTSPRQHLANADKYFFSKDILTQRNIMSRILRQRAAEDMQAAEKAGLVKKDENGLYYNVGLDSATILQMATNIGQSVFGNNKASGAPFELKKHPEGKKNVYGPNSKACISAAIQQYVLDCSIKHMMSMLEYQRLFSGSKSFYKWNDNGTHITDISVDYTKRRGGDISTGGVNITDIDPIAGMEELGTYRVIEIKDYKVESTTLGQKMLIEKFEADELVSTARAILSGNDSSSMNIRNTNHKENLYDDVAYAERIVRERYGADFVKVLKQKAKANAMSYFVKEDKKAPVNVADGATYITDRMCEKLLREEGKWDDNMKYAFEVLRGEHGADVLSKEGQKLYRRVLDVIIGTQKYTATGFRKSNDGQGGTLMTPYYNKTALFPIFDKIAYGKMHDVLGMMRANNVDMVMMTSAVKVGSQGAVSFKDFISGRNYSDHAYVLEMRFLRKQLNTDPAERDEMNFGTQTIKIALSNLRMNDDYTDPFTGKTVKGKDLYKNIMRCYNILTDIGFELVMQRFGKKDANGHVIYNNHISTITNNKGETVRILPEDGHIAMPNIDEEALSTFLYLELMSRDANSNMFDAIAYNKENDRLAAPLSAISGSGWIDSIISSYISKTIIDTKSPGEPFIQRSVFAMEGEGLKTLNGGKDLQLINEDGSMDAVISIDFFKDVIPDYKNKTFEEAKEWLIKHKLIGKDAKTYTISYRIPTQAQSSINPLKFVDVLPIVRDTIILPKEFTALTGSDFDIDKLFLSRLFINPDTVHDADKMFTFLDDKKDISGKLDNMRKAFTNHMFQQYLTLLMDKNSYGTKWRPIDKDTDLWKEVYDDLYAESDTPILSMSQDTIAYQTEQKANFVTGKTGIGPYALNNNNHIYTMLYGISLYPDSRLHDLGEDHLDMGTLYRDKDIYGNSILSWISGGINAHVDIAKDPFVTKLNINEYTYNISNFLLRAGFGRNALWFLNLPSIKELSKRMNAVNGEYMKATNKDRFEAQKDILDAYKNELRNAIPQEVKDKPVKVNEQFDTKFKQILGRDLTVNDILFERWKVKNAITNIDLSILQEWLGEQADGKKAIVVELAQAAFDKMCEDYVEKAFLDDMVETDKKKSILYHMAKGDKITEVVKYGEMPLEDSSLYAYMSVLMFESINKKEAKTTSDLTKFMKIDTKKHGSTVAAQIDFLHRYETFLSEIDEKVTGDVDAMFGRLDRRDLLGFDVNLTLYDMDEANLIESDTPGNVLYAGYDMLPARNPYASFIDNKTKKAINALMTIIHNDSIEGTYGFQVIWEKIKQDLGNTSLTDEMQSKLRSAILGAFKNVWALNAARSNGIDPVTLFRDTYTTKSLAHELVELKSKWVVETTPTGKRRRVFIKDKFRKNALFKILHDAHSRDEYRESDRMMEVLDFILAHVPFADDTKDANVYIDAWRELYRDETTKDFAVKLMFYSLLVSNDTGGNNLFKYVPFEMLEQYGLFKFERKAIEYLGNPFMILAKISESKRKILEKDKDILDKNTQDDENDDSEIKILYIVDYVESILANDFDFSPVYKIETKQETQDGVTGATVRYDRKEYIGFGNVQGFGRVEGTTENKDPNRIPYLFLPVRKTKSGQIVLSDSFKDKNGHVINRAYIRVLNPIANYENDQKYLIYKKIGEIVVGKTILPIYLITNNPLYTIGQHKVYNYGNSMDINSSQAMYNMRKYTISSVYTLEQLDEFINHVVDIANKKPFNDIEQAIGAFEAIDLHIARMNAQRKYEERVARTRDFLSLHKDLEYLNAYRSGKVDQEQTINDLQFAINDKSFTQEEKTIAKDMLDTIKQWHAYVRQSSEGHKLPNTANDPKTYTMHSGGAHGADTDWNRVGSQYGITEFEHYYYDRQTPNGNAPISKAEFNEGTEHVLVANQTLRRENTDQYMSLLARNWKQVKESDAIFAIGELKNGYVNGGTGWAVQMAIDEGKPVHVFDLNTQKWYRYDTTQRTFASEETPRLTKNFAGIGTRSIDPDIEQKTNGKVKYVGDAKRQAAIDAIDSVFKNTFGDIKKSQEDSIPKFTKVNDDFAEVLIKHLQNDDLPGEYYSSPKRESLVNLTKALFEYFKKNNVKIIITNAPYSKVEKGKSSTVAMFKNYATIYYQDSVEQGNKYLNIVHELLHVATRSAIPFDGMGRYIEDEKLQLYYQLFLSKVRQDPEWKDIQDIVFNPTKEIFEKASDRAKALAHAYSNVGEFLSCAISYADVQNTLTSITYGEVKTSNVFKELLLWFADTIERIFHGYSYIDHANFTNDIIEFLVNAPFDEGTPVFDSIEEKNQYDSYVRKQEDRYNDAVDFKNNSKDSIPEDTKPEAPKLSVDPESWSKKEGWSIEYFNEEVMRRIDKAWQIEFEYIPDKQKEESTSGPSSYTYQDGATIETPFQLTVEQANALEKIEDFINSDAPVLTVSGYAGTGKTSVMEIVAQKHKKDRLHSFIFTASTNKASQVLASKVSKKGFRSSTLDKYFGLRQEQKSNAKYYNARDTQTIPAEFKGDYGDIVIIDEASMIGKDKYDIITNIAQAAGIKIIFLGDIAQLPPVGEAVSPVFQKNDNLIQLTEVKRTGDNAILKEATNLRRPAGQFSYESSFNNNGEGVAFTSKTTEIFKIISAYAPLLQKDNNALKIVTGTNESVEKYNQRVRRILGYDTAIPQVGESIMGYNNWGAMYDPLTRKTTYSVINSEDYVVSKVGETKKKKVFLPDDIFGSSGELVEIEYTSVTLTDTTGREITIPYVLYENNADALRKVANTIQKLNVQKAQAWKSGNKSAGKSAMDMLRELEGSIAVDRDVMDDHGNTIIKKAIDFGYAITAYKSQGSTYKHVIIDKNNIDTVQGWDAETKQRMYYTAVSRATTTATVLTQNTKTEGNPVDNQVKQNVNKGEVGMYYSYEGRKRQDVTSDTTFDAIMNGERTATTRFEGQPGIDWWKSLKEGDEITFRSTEKKDDPNARRLNVRITKAATRLSQSEVKPDAPKVINVNAGGEYGNLSNFASRKFKAKVSKDFAEIEAANVEQAYQISKAFYAYSCGDITFEKLKEVYNKMKSTTSGKELRALGKNEFTLSLQSKAAWDGGLSDKTLLRLMRTSFEQNETAAQALLDTGDAEITHNFNNGRPIEPSDPKRFGRLLSQVRSDIRQQRELQNNCK